MIVSNLAGRIRVQDDKLKEATFAKELCKCLRAIKGVRKARHTELIGSLLVEYNMNTVSESEVLALLREHVNCAERAGSGPLEPIMSGLKAAKGGKRTPSAGGRQSMGRRDQSVTDASGAPPILSGVLHSLIPFAEGSPLLGNILKTVLPSVLGYKAYRAGRARMGGGGRHR